MGKIVCKFGGSSVADAALIQRVASIVRSDPRRRFVVPSAPGKCSDDDSKVTDLLYLCHELGRQKINFADPFGKIRQRFSDLCATLNSAIDMDELLDEVECAINAGAARDYVASRGEYLSGRIIADVLDATFVDPAEAILFRSDRRLDVDSYQRLRARLGGDGLYVIPGFYGADADGDIVTFSRGGSDITGAIVARAVGAKVYENWTDVSGLLMADPRMVPEALPVEEITYREMRELAYMGAAVFHDEAMFPVRTAEIPVHIRNTHRPDDPGTRILPSRRLTERMIAGVAGRSKFTMLTIEKALMNQARGFGQQVLEVIARHGISYDHTPSAIDSMAVIIRDEELGNKGDLVVEEIQRILQPDRVELVSGLALIATVGEGMAQRVGIAARLFSALAEAEVNVRVVDQGASQINVIVGVEEADLKKALVAIYRAFVN